MSKILVIGSSNTDLIAKVDRFPAAGETVVGGFFMQAMGGKGANQALAARRAGGDVKFIACLGNDLNGNAAIRYYQQEGLDVSLIQQVKNVSTGTAMILVNNEGENCIVITPGANHELAPSRIPEFETEIAAATMIMLQMEIPFETVKQICAIAKEYKTPILLNVAPARKIEADLIKLVEILVVNETEIEIICGQKIEEVGEEGVIDTLIGMGAKTVILTLGKRGCIVKSKTLHHFTTAFEVETKDSTAAGDTFCGALVARLSKGATLIEAVEFATAAAAICVTKIGAQPSIPTEEEVTGFLLTHTTTRNGNVNVKH